MPGSRSGHASSVGLAASNAASFTGRTPPADAPRLTVRFAECVGLSESSSLSCVCLVVWASCFTLSSVVFSTFPSQKNSPTPFVQREELDSSPGETSTALCLGGGLRIGRHGRSGLDRAPSQCRHLRALRKPWKSRVPRMFDLGEQAKVAILSVTEGTDKPAKYPHMFRAASLMIINKIDLMPCVDFDTNAWIGFAREVNPNIEVIQLSATRGDGLEAWYGWLEGQRPNLPFEGRS